MRVSESGAEDSETLARSTKHLSGENAMDLQVAATLLASGGLVAFPTETVYGLGANAWDTEAVGRIFTAKDRPSWDPVIVHIAELAMLRGVVVPSSPGVEQRVRQLSEEFWPGPLTMLLPRSNRIPDEVTAGRPLVGVRMPDHPVALDLLRRAAVPVAAPSANRFGRTSPTTAAHVLTDLDGRIDAVLDGGASVVGVESTVVEVREHELVVYRPGAVTVAQLRAVVGPTRLLSAAGGSPQTASNREGLPSPGFGLRHYAPWATLVLVDDEDSVREACAKSVRDGRRVGVLLPAGWATPEQVDVYPWGAWRDTSELARRLFAGLRELDARGVDMIVCPLPAEEGGMGAALRDRLEKAARPA